MHPADAESPRSKVSGEAAEATRQSSRMLALLLRRFFFIADEVQPHDSSFTVECLARALERVNIIAREKGVKPVVEFILWADNTVRENKNNTVLSYLAWLVKWGMMQFLSLIHI